MLRRTRAIAVLVVWAWAAALQGQAASERGALIRSLVLPGWGQQVLGERATARRFMLAEASLWLGYAVTRSASGWYRQDYLAFAALHAEVDLDRLPDSDIYYFNLGRYDSILEYNQVQMRRRNLDSLYPVGAGIDWLWDEPSHRQRYTELREASLLAAKSATFVLAGLVVNRAVAAIHVLMVSRLGPSSMVAWRSVPGGGLLELEVVF
ncbi:MAG: hypothetical protein V3U35_09390 [Candidatus Neomarinimicrobiota bacterium]